MAAKRLRKPDWLLFALPLLIPVLYFGASAVRHRFQYEVQSNVGHFVSVRAGQQAIVKRLSNLLKEHPNATQFRIYGNYPKSRPMAMVIYTRNLDLKPTSWHSEGYGDNELLLLDRSVGYPGEERDGIMDEDIHEVARGSGDVKDVFRRASERYLRLDSGRKTEEKKLGVDIDFADRHYPKGTLDQGSH